MTLWLVIGLLVCVCESEGTVAVKHSLNTGRHAPNHNLGVREGINNQVAVAPFTLYKAGGTYSYRVCETIVQDICQPV
jgi:hypothetical protein